LVKIGNGQSCSIERGKKDSQNKKSGSMKHA